HTRFSRDWSSDVCSSDLHRPNNRPNNSPTPPQSNHNTNSRPKFTCNYCGFYTSHAPEQCIAKGKTCNKCQKIGHFESVCKSGPQIGRASCRESVYVDGLY